MKKFVEIFSKVNRKATSENINSKIESQEYQLENENSQLKNQELKYVEQDLNNKKINFSKLRSDKNYQKALQVYLYSKGYGYVSKKLKEAYESKQNNLDEIVAYLLYDSALIDHPEVVENNPFSNNKVIEYERRNGLEKDYHITYTVKVDFPFRVLAVDWENTNIVTCTVDSEKKIKVSIHIPANTEKIYNCTETLIIYTTHEMKKIEFDIKCTSESYYDNDLGLENINEFYEMINEDIEKANEKFLDKKFREWLNRNNYYLEALNYDDSITMAEQSLNSESHDALKIFCRLMEHNLFDENTRKSDEKCDKPKEDIEENDTGNNEVEGGTVELPKEPSEGALPQSDLSKGLNGGTLPELDPPEKKGIKKWIKSILEYIKNKFIKW